MPCVTERRRTVPVKRGAVRNAPATAGGTGSCRARPAASRFLAMLDAAPGAFQDHVLVPWPRFFPYLQQL